MKKKLLSIITVLSSVVFCCKLSAQNYEWTETVGGIDNDVVKSITTDDSGNVYYTGYYSGTYDFDGSAGVDIHTCAGSSDFFVVKKDVAGNYLWAKTFGNAGSDRAYSITTDSLGNIIIGGNFQNTLDFDLSSGVASHTPVGQYDAFILKLDNNGDFIWVKTFGGAGASSYPLSLQCDNNGNIIDAGVYSFAGIDADPSINTVSLPFYGGVQDIYVQKLDFNGNYLWSASAGGTGVDRANSLTVDSNGNSYVAGYFQNTVDFNTGAGTDNRTATFDDAFVLKLDAAGNYVNCVTTGGASNEQNYSVFYSEQSNSIYVAGSFAGTVDFDYGAGTDTKTATGSTDAFVQKLDLSLNHIWVKTIGGNFFDNAYSVATDQLGNIYSTGRFNVSIDLNPGAGTDTRTTNGTFDCYIQKLDAAGNYVWGITFGGPGVDQPFFIAIHNPGDLYVSGTFNDSLDFNPFAGFDSISSVGVDDGFISHYTFCVNTAKTISPTACDSYTLNTQTYTSSGTYTQTLTNTAGCDSILTINLTINTVDVSITVGSASIMANSNTGTYQWIDCNNGNAIIVGAINQIYTPSNNGNYAVIVTDNGCVDTSTCVNIFSVGINNISLSDEIFIYPNPSDGIFSISLNNRSKTEIEIHNVIGELIYKTTKVTPQTTIDLSNVSKGIYFVRITDSNKNITNKKVIIQ